MLNVGDRVRFLNPFKFGPEAFGGHLATGTIIEVLENGWVRVCYDIDEAFWSKPRNRALRQRIRERGEAEYFTFTQVADRDIEVIS